MLTVAGHSFGSDMSPKHSLLQTSLNSVGFHTWRYPEIDGLYFHDGKSYENGFRGTPILGPPPDGLHFNGKNPMKNGRFPRNRWFIY